MVMRTNAQFGPSRLAFTVHSELKHLRFDRIRRLFVLFTFTFDVTFTSSETGR